MGLTCGLSALLPGLETGFYFVNIKRSTFATTRRTARFRPELTYNQLRQVNDSS